jgi:hypothetical protein
MLRTCQGEFMINCKHCFLSSPTTRLGLEVEFLTTASEHETRHKGMELYT